MTKTAKATPKEKKTQSQDQESVASSTQVQKQAQAAEFTEVSDENAGATGPGSKLDILLDMSVPIMAAIGRTEVSVRRLLQLGPSSVLKLDKPVDEPVDLFLRDTKFATGEVVVVEDRFAVRIKEIIGAGVSSAQKKAQPA
jgi:flagellar motor switch protein FliN/FliY